MKNDTLSKFAIVIPAYNESTTIASVVALALNKGHPIVIDDASTDQTRALAETEGATVISVKKNIGYDRALALGIENAIAEDFDYAITIDGDGQHDTKYIEHFKLKLVNGADLVLGVRNKYQRPAEFIFGKFAHVVWGISDPLCGMKGYRLKRFKQLSKLYNYPSIGTEMTICAIKSQWRIEEVRIKMKEREGNSKFGSGWLANWRIMKALMMGILYAIK